MRCAFDEVKCSTNDKFVCFQCGRCAKKIALLKTLKPEFMSILSQLPDCPEAQEEIAPTMRFEPTAPMQMTYSTTSVEKTTTAGDLLPPKDPRVTARPEPVKFKENPAGAGTQLKRLLSRVGIKASDTCSCTARATKMDEMGIEWCEQNIPEIVGWLKEEAAKRKLPFLAYPTKVIVQRAIKMAKKVRDAQQP